MNLRPPDEPRLKLAGRVSIPWYKLPIVEVPYTRLHVTYYLLTMCGLAIGIGGAMILTLAVLFGAAGAWNFTWMLGVLGAALVANFHGRGHWYFSEIEQVACSYYETCNCVSIHGVADMKEAEHLIREIQSESTTPEQRQILRKQLKDTLSRLAASEPEEAWAPLHEKVPYLNIRS